jgi:hypothetical protein
VGWSRPTHQSRKFTIGQVLDLLEGTDLPGRYPAGPTMMRGEAFEKVAAATLGSVKALTQAVKSQDAQVRELRGRLDGCEAPRG